MKRTIKQWLYAIVLVILLQLKCAGAITPEPMIVYDARGNVSGILYRGFYYKPVRTLSDGRIQIRYSGKVGYLKPATR